MYTLDGLRINTRMNVLDTEGEPVKGLYAAGDCSGSSLIIIRVCRRRDWQNSDI